MRSLWFCLLLACGSPAADTAADEATETSPTLPDTTGEPCVLDPSIEVSGTPLPGMDLDLSSGVDPTIPDLTHEWTVSGGTLSDAAAAEPQWTLGQDAALHQAEVLELGLTVSAPDCSTAQAAASVEVSRPESDRVLIITNPSAEGSSDVGLAYADLRDIPTDRICAIPSDETKTLDGADMADWMAALQDCIDAAGEQIHYLVPVYGVPYRVSSRIKDMYSDSTTNASSLDALMVFGLASVDFTTHDENPIYQSGTSISGNYRPYVPFGELREALDAPYYLVVRMDGADADAALALVERAREAAELAEAGALSGTVYVDGRYGDKPPESEPWGSYDYGEWNMWGTRLLFEELAWYPVVWDGNDAEFGTKPAPTWCPDALYYAGWYSYNNYNDAFEWAPGAIGGHLDSCSACDIRSGSAWVANALQQGITATFGAVAEPYVTGMPEYDQFFLYLTQGASYGEAAYESTRISRWMMTFVGDPLYRPYPSSARRAGAGSGSALELASVPVRTCRLGTEAVDCAP